MAARTRDWQAWLRSCLTTWRLAMREHLQYRGQHMINNLGSAMFGFVYIAVWQAVAAGRDLEPGYSTLALARYIAISQCLIWITVFDHTGLEMGQRVRDGSIASDLLRPVGLMSFYFARIYGCKTYNFLFRSLAMALVFGLAIGLPWPVTPGHWVSAVVAWALAAHVGVVLTYFVGLAAFWTTDPGWLYLGLQTLTIFMGGVSIPLDFMPAGLRSAALVMPFACQSYYPTAVTLGLRGPEALAPLAFWAVALTWLAGALTRLARRRVEVAGG